MKHSTISALGASILLAVPSWAQAQVPSKYQDLYDQVQGNLTRFKGVIDSAWNGVTYPVLFNAELSGADSSQGATLLRPNRLEGIKLELDGLQALGVTGVNIGLNFPVLYRPFHASESEYQQYLTFYKSVASEVRARGLKLVVETQAVLSEPGWSNLNVGPYYNSLTLSQYTFGRAELARTIARELTPDYLNVIGEPDTEANTSGKTELGTLSGSTQLLNEILGRLAGYRTGIKVGAGFGTWMNSHLSWVDSFAATSIDYLDMHVYPANRDFLDRVIQIADRVNLLGKPVAVGETFSHKVRDSELGIVPFNEILRRNNFSFWQPLDTLHLQNMVKLAHFKRLLYLSPFWSLYFRAYLDYTAALDALPTYQLRAEAASVQVQASLDGVFTGTGLQYKNAIVGFTDIVPPSPPSGLDPRGISTSTIYITWPSTPDNIGTAGYRLYRDGAQVYKGAQRFYIDEGLQDGRTYRYTLSAFDASGNLSSLSASVFASTLDGTPPTAPANLVATLTSPTTISLSWSPATDNVGIAGYYVFRGNTPLTINQLFGFVTSGTSFVNTVGFRNTTYYYQVQAVDTSYRMSPMSNLAWATTPPNF